MSNVKWISFYSVFRHKDCSITMWCNCLFLFDFSVGSLSYHLHSCSKCCIGITIKYEQQCIIVVCYQYTLLFKICLFVCWIGKQGEVTLNLVQSSPTSIFSVCNIITNNASVIRVRFPSRIRLRWRLWYLSA